MSLQDQETELEQCAQGGIVPGFGSWTCLPHMLLCSLPSLEHLCLGRLWSPQPTLCSAPIHLPVVPIILLGDCLFPGLLFQRCLPSEVLWDSGAENGEPSLKEMFVAPRG